MKLLVLGSAGLLGSSLVPSLMAQGHVVTGHARGQADGLEQADLTDAGQVHKLLGRTVPDVTINLAGLADVDRCECEPQSAWSANVLAAENVSAACRAAECHLVHISTDQVYDGPAPCSEFQARPGNYYAITKYAGELAALSAGATVLRTNFFGASRHPTRRSLTDWLFDSLTAGRAVRVFEDVYFSPLSVATLSEMIGRVAALRPAGVFNLGSRSGLSKADFAFAFARTLGLEERLMERVPVAQASLKAWRPSEMRMNMAKIEAVLQRELPTLVEEIETAAKDYRARI